MHSAQPRVLTLTQERAVLHGSSNPHEIINLGANVLSLVATATDGDDDKTANSFDIGRQLNFQDSGPVANDDFATVTATADVKTFNVLNDGAGKDAVTEWKLLSITSGCALILCRLLTGRTHQIRVHMKECLLAPILGDPLYGHPSRQPMPSTRLMLHAWRLAFEHPIKLQPMAFEAKIPVEYQPWLGDPSVLDAVKTMR